MSMATMETWRAGPMGFDWESLTPSQCDKKHDQMTHAHAIKWHSNSPPNSIPTTVRKDMEP